MVLKAKELFKNELLRKIAEKEVISSYPNFKYDADSLTHKSTLNTCSFSKQFDNNAICPKDEGEISSHIHSYLSFFREQLRSLNLKSRENRDDSLIMINAASILRRVNITKPSILEEFEKSNGMLSESSQSTLIAQNNYRALLPSSLSQ